MRACDRCGVSDEEVGKKGYNHIQNIHMNTTNVGTEIDVDLCNGCRAELLNLIREFIKKR